jgi:pantoate--beta-alanine ligase
MTRARRVERIAGIRRLVASWKDLGPVGFVPTMGALHAGHERLIRQARDECAHVVVSIFVNPLQFDRKDDLERYPRTLESDAEMCERIGVEALFLPSVDEMYPAQPACTVDPGPLATHLCGAFRPGHFRGVATVVLKLLNSVGADRAYFGEKDAQQLAIIRRMVADFDVPVAIVGVPTVREVDGLALSSRNVRLNAHERALAPRLYRALQTADRHITAGETDVKVIKQAATAILGDEEGLRLEYFDMVDPERIQPVESITGPVLVAGALWVGSTRLIDNIRSIPPSAS